MPFHLKLQFKQHYWLIWLSQ